MAWLSAVLAYGLTTSTALLLINSGSNSASIETRRLLGVPLSPMFLLGIATYGISLVLWLFVAANATPIVAYGSAVASASVWLTALTILTHKQWSAAHLLGLALVVGGAALLRRPI